TCLKGNLNYYKIMFMEISFVNQQCDQVLTILYQIREWDSKNRSLSFKEMKLKTLPVIDLSPFTDSNNFDSEFARQTVARELHFACRDVGFFYLKGHGIPQDTCDHVLKLASEGYQRLGENVTRYQKDWHEALDYYKPIPRNHPLVVKNLPLRGENQWPTNPSEFRSVFEQYIEHMKSLGAKVMSAIAMGIGLEHDYFAEFIDDSFWVMRVIGYPPLNSANGLDRVKYSCGEHTDALQVKTKEGDWINVDPIPNSFVVNIGDMLNGLVSTFGRNEALFYNTIKTHANIYIMDKRIPFFYEPNFDAKIEPLSKCLEVDPISHHEGVVYGEHLLSK
ncbi:22000_t:CDS:2, partial [Dentiscutata erythropus]